MNLLESILGERSRNVARIKREKFNRGVSCMEPLDKPSVSWQDEAAAERDDKDNKDEKDEHKADKVRQTETEKLRDLISVRRSSHCTGLTAQPLLRQTSLNTAQLVLKTSERPPLQRGYSCQATPTITLTRPHSSHAQSTLTRPHSSHAHSSHAQSTGGRPDTDILTAVSEIHDQFKEHSVAAAETEDETEDEFHELLQG